MLCGHLAEAIRANRHSVTGRVTSILILAPSTYALTFTRLIKDSSPAVILLYNITHTHLISGFSLISSIRSMRSKLTSSLLTMLITF